MTFTLVGSTIEQTGTDLDLSGLAGVAGVSTLTQGSITVYDIGDRQFDVLGDLTIDPEIEMLLIGYDGANDLFRCLSGGHLTIGKAILQNGYTRYSEGLAIYLDDTETGQINRFSFLSGSQLTWNGGIVSMYAGKFNLLTDSTTVRINSANAKLIYRTQNVQNQVRQETDDFISTAFELINGELTVVGTGQQLNGYIPTHCTGAISFSSATPNVEFDIRDYGGGARGNDIDSKQWQGGRPLYKNSATGSDFKVGPHISGSASAFGIVRVFQELDVNVVEFGNGVVEGAKIWFQDYDNGDRRLYDSEAPNIDLQQTFTYQGTSDVSGDIPTLEVLTGAVISTVAYGNAGDPVNTGRYAWDYRSKTGDTSDLFDLSFASYNHTLLALSDISLKGAGGTAVTATLFVDPSISELSKTVVDTYTELETAVKGYDGCKSYLVDNYAGENELLVDRTENSLDFHNYDVVYDATASSNVDLTGNTLTIKASSYSDEVITTGTVTAINGADLSGALITDSTGSNTRITVTELVSSNVQVINDSDIVLDRQVNVTGTYVFTTDIGVVGDHKVVINREGYTPRIYDVTLSGGDIVLVGELLEYLTPSGSSMYQGTTSSILSVVPTADGSSMRAEVGNGTVTAQNVFDECENALQTQDGMTYLGNDGQGCTIASLATGIFLFLQDNFQLKRALPGDSSATVEAFVTSTQGTVVDNTNGDVQFVTVTRAQQLTEYDGAVWVDLLNGFDENQYPAGTPSRKTDSITNAVMIAQFYGLNVIRMSGISTALPQSLIGYSFIADLSTDPTAALLPTINITTSETASNCMFEGFIIEGATDVTSPTFGNEYKGCVINGLTGLTGVAADSKLSGTLQVEYDIDLVNCYGTSTIEASGANATVNIPNYSGAITVTGMTGAGASVQIGVVSGTVDIDATCVAGVVIVANADLVTDNSGPGCTVIIINDVGGGGATPQQIWEYDISLIATPGQAGAELQSKLDTSAYTAPDNSSIADILVDTNELQLNQNNWLTATGFATPTDVTDSETVITTAIGNLNDLSSADVTAAVPSVTDIDAELTTQHGAGSWQQGAAGTVDANIVSVTSTPVTDVTDFQADVSLLATSAEIAALNDISEAQVNAQVDIALADYGGPTLTELTAAFTEIKGPTWSSSTDTLEAIRDRGDAAWTTAVGFSTPTDITDSETVITTAIGNLNDLSSADVTAAVPSVLDIDSQLSTTHGSGSWESAVVGTVDANIVSVTSTAVTDVDDFKADVSGLSTFDPVTDVVAQVTLVDTTTTNTDMRGTDNALLATSYTAPDNASISFILADTNELQTNQNNWLTATGFATPTDVTDSEVVITTAIGNLNDLSSGDVTAAVPSVGDIDLELTTQHGAGSWQQGVTGTVQANVISVDGNVVTSADDFKADVSNLDVTVSSRATQVSVDTIPTNPVLTTDTRLDNLDATISSRATQTSVDDVLTDISNLPTTGDISALQVVLDLLEKYHDNNTRFFGADGLSEVKQSESYFMVVYDNDGTTELKRISFRNASNVESVITDATRYIKL